MNYHAAQLGEQEDAPERFREVRIQKYLLSRPQWIGIVVHDIAEQALRALSEGLALAPATAAASALARANADLDASERKLWLEDPKGTPGFQDHYYNATSRWPWTDALEDIVRLTMGLFQHPIYRRIAQVPEQLAEVEELIEGDLEGTPARVRLDALLRDELGGMVVIDWKTGRSNDPEVIRQQLAVYGVYVRQQYRAPTKGIYADLRAGTWRAFDYTDEELNRTTAFVKASAEAMQAADPAPEDITDKELEFQKIPEGSRSCRWCSFRRDCGR